ncbi:hypothetical protein N7528_007617 [Penicillium herquei]|nr:hypothetical protein N7528_007617 [Penicillium herquei]
MALYNNSSWFHQGPMRRLTEIGSVINLTKPQVSSWIICESLKERVSQVAEHEATPDNPSFASLKLRCTNIDKTIDAMMRIYLQIPYVNTELEPPTTRASQASSFNLKPKELTVYQMFCDDPKVPEITPNLLAYKETTQPEDNQQVIPSGFLIFVVWELLPGIHLKDPSIFWALDRLERDAIRAAFLETLRLFPVFPTNPGLKNLLWDKENQKLFWVGFRDWFIPKPGKHSKQKPDDFWFEKFELVRIPTRGREKRRRDSSKREY